MSAGLEPAESPRKLVHGTAIALGERGVLIRGRSGLGKSDLALRAVCSGATDVLPELVRLISDDQVLVSHERGRLYLTAPEAIHGKLEVRGVGLVDLSRRVLADGPVQLVMVVDLVEARSEIERLPEPYLVDFMGQEIAGLRLYPFEASAVEKLRLAAQSVPL